MFLFLYGCFMCLFPLPNLDVRGLAYKKGVTQFSCGSCPECLSKRASSWALRCVYESKLHIYNCMVCLTYDTYIYDKFGNIVGERVSDLHVSKRDLQLFMKRLRKWYSSITDERIKYLACAEYGKRTGRPHYHCLLFGVRFPDCVPYKLSKRHNQIYRSAILEKLWPHGICTVDSLSINSASARYCTKYIAKQRADDTFMLFSQHIGFDSLISDFNGKSYFIEGREYPIPRFVWEWYISQKYRDCGIEFDFRYLNKTDDSLSNGSYLKNSQMRDMYRIIRDSDSVYQKYLEYWSNKSLQFEQNKLPVYRRIVLLKDDKYHFYKINALKTLSLRNKGVPAVAPNSKCVSSYRRYFKSLFPNSFIDEFGNTCPIVSCPNRASDTNGSFVSFQKLNKYEKRFVFDKKGKIYFHNFIDNPF